MPFTADKDAEFGDAYFDISRTEKRLIRAKVKSYQNTGTYVFLKLFKKVDKEYELQQRITLTLGQFELLSKRSAKIRSAAVGKATENDQANKAPAAKYVKLKKTTSKTIQTNYNILENCGSNV